ncbi:extracellular solute-binding protein [Paenibacillus solisilvae]|uniref:Extracellular solute-binding protein n=1 Tax=Paenibacillus solisilvae TaxID=2486751 RepID=A0ABW0VST0_9BACL
MRKRPFIIVLVLLLSSMTLFTACSGFPDNAEQKNSSTEQTGDLTDNGTDTKANEVGTQDNKTQDNKTEENATVVDGLLTGKFNPEVTITTVRGVAPGVTFRDGENVDDNVHTKWAKERFGINIKNLWSVTDQNDAYKTKLRLALSSNEPMPDVMIVFDVNLAQDLISSGKFMDIGDKFEQKAAPMWKKALEEYSYTWNPFKKDGKKYGIPLLSYGYGSDPVLWIRQDWLDKLNLKAPQTMDDVEHIMDAFTNQDPDNDGKKDTYGLVIAPKASLSDGIGNASWIFGAYGVVPEQWNMTADGKVGFGSVQPEMKAGLEKLKQWYDKGFLPRDTGLYDGGKVAEVISKGNIGMIAGPQWLPWYPFPDLVKNDPTAKMKPFNIPTGPDGQAGRNGTVQGGYAILINKDIEPRTLEALFVYMNYLFENLAIPRAGSEFEHGYFENYDWAMKDGQPSRKNEDIPGGYIDAKKYFLFWEMPLIPEASVEPMIKRYKGEPLTTPNDMFYKDHPEDQVQGYGKIVEQAEASKVNVFNGAPTPTMKKKWELLEKIKQETFSKIIFGNAPVSQFDTFVNEWNSTGGDAVTQEVNEWYQSVSQ